MLELMPTELTTPRSIFNDFADVIAAADLADLRPLPDDLKSKRGRSGPVSIQGMILDAMDDDRLDALHAGRLLVMCNQRMHGKFAGLCKVTPEGDLMAIGAISQGGD
jgi:hypothetical protein